MLPTWFNLSGVTTALKSNNQPEFKDRRGFVTQEASWLTRPIPPCH